MLRFLKDGRIKDETMQVQYELGDLCIVIHGKSIHKNSDYCSMKFRLNVEQEERLLKLLNQERNRDIDKPITI